MATQEVKDLFASEHQQVFRGTFTFPDSTTLVVTEADIISGSVVLDRSCVSGNSLELGACMANEFGFELMNIDNKFDGYSFAGAELYAEIGVLDDNETAYYIPLGRFIVDGVPKVRDAVSIVALDRMVKFDKLATTTLDATWWGSGKTIQQIINRCCSVCGVTLATNISSFPNVEVTLGAVDEVFTSGIESITYRQLLSYCVGAMGKCAWMNPEGLLEIGFAEALDIETSAIAGIAIVGVAIVGDNSGYGEIQQTLDENNRYSSEYEDYTIAITGAYCTKTEKDSSGEQYEHKYIIGSDDYAFDLSENPIVAWNPSTFLANLVGVIGITYSPITAVTVPYPWLMPLDWVSYSKGDTNLYSIITNYTFTMNGNNGIQSVGESPQEKALASVGSVSKLVKQMVNYTNDVAVNTLTQAQTDATNLITSATGGQMYFKKENGKIVEATMMDDACYEDFISSNPQYNVGTCWRWNKNGFGYSDEGYNGGTNGYKLAMTANGAIVADFITTGTLSADRIRGGELKLGGYNNQYGILRLYNDTDGLELVLNKDNLAIYHDGVFAGAFGSYIDTSNGIWNRISSTYGNMGIAFTVQETSGGGYYQHYTFYNDAVYGFTLYNNTHDRYARMYMGTVGGQLQLYGSSNAVVYLGTSSAERGMLQLRNASGTNLVSLYTSTDGTGMLDLYDSSGNRKVRLSVNGSQGTGYANFYDASGTMTAQIDGNGGNIYATNESGTITKLQPIMKLYTTTASFNEYSNYNTGLSASTYTVLSARGTNSSSSEGLILIPFVAYGTWWVKGLSWYDISAKSTNVVTIYYIKQV